VPTSSPESDGTYEWDRTTIVIVEVSGGGARGIGYGYADAATATLIDQSLKRRVLGQDALSPQASWIRMRQGVRNLGSPGIASMAISAVDIALWDLKAKLLSKSLVELLGAVRPSVMAYGSGGFTSYTFEELRAQLGGWVNAGIRAVKMKIGREPARDVDRVTAARDAIGDAQLFVDANGAYSRKQALKFAEEFANLGVVWFEEPVSSDDLEGLRLLRDHGPAGMDIAAGEYGYDVIYFRRMLEAGAVDVLQADATRCGGVTGFMKAAEICDAYGLPLSAHTAPSVHAHLCCAASRARHVEYFHDHVRIEQMFFEGAATAAGGELKPRLDRPGLGIEFRRAEAAKYQVFAGGES
jgi:L-alanine-DL-glutamate epimerase-like enolase superfamily enzyme